MHYFLRYPDAFRIRRFSTMGLFNNYVINEGKEDYLVGLQLMIRGMGILVKIILINIGETSLR